MVSMFTMFTVWLLKKINMYAFLFQHCEIVDVVGTLTLLPVILAKIIARDGFSNICYRH